MENKTYFLDQNLLRLSISDESGVGNYDIANFECLEIEDEGIEKTIITKLNNHNELVKALDWFLQYDKENDLLGWLKDFNHIVHTEFSVIMKNAANIIDKLKAQ